MTAHAMSDEQELCREAGMVAHLAKPIDVQVLFRTLTHWMPAHPKK